MIKTVIAGGSSPLAGELIRILINHPEVDLLGIFSPSLAGHWIGSRHLGLVGETDMRFADRLDLSNTDVIFLFKDALPFIGNIEIPEDIRIVTVDEISQDLLPDHTAKDTFSTGLSELYRKPLVRGASGARILNSAVAVSVIALYPLALHLMLNDEITLNCALPYWILRKKDKEALRKDIDSILESVQLSFTGIKEAAFHIGKDSRAVSLHVSMPCNVAIEEIRKAYEGIYDDHNFTFLVDHTPDRAEVLGTQKCLIHLHKPSLELLEIEVVADGVYRGGVGDAVHSMNLLFGLFEKIGLTFKAPMAFKESYHGD